MTMEKELPEGWVEDALGNIVIVERGSSPRPIKNYITDEGGVHWVKIGDTREGQKYVTSTKERITKEGALKSRFVKPGDFILSNSMSFGRPYVMAVEGYIHDGWFALRLPNIISPDYFYYLILSSYVQSQFQQLAVGGVVKNISGDLVKKALLPLPPLAEQQVIADTLDALLAQVATTKTRLERVPETIKRFRQSVLAAAVSGKLTEAWRRENCSEQSLQKKSINEVCSSAFDGPFGSKLKTADYTDTGVRVARLENIGQLVFDNEKTTYISEEKFSELTKHRLFEGDVLFSSFVDENVRVCVFDDFHEAFINKADVFCLRPNQELVLPQVLAMTLASQSSYRQIKNQVQGVTRPRINLKILKSLTFNFSPLPEQQEIVRRVEELFAHADAVEQQAKAALEKVNNLTQSILAKAFRGELTADWRAANPELISGENSAEALLARIKEERAAQKPKKRATTRGKKKVVSD